MPCYCPEWLHVPQQCVRVFITCIFISIWFLSRLLICASLTYMKYLTVFFVFWLLLLLFFFFWLHWVLIAARGLSLVAVSGGYSSLQCMCFSLQWLLLLQSTGSRCAGFSSCGTQAQELWLAGSRA